jgi:hypothetical protein
MFTRQYKGFKYNNFAWVAVSFSRTSAGSYTIGVRKNHTGNKACSKGATSRIYTFNVENKNPKPTEKTSCIRKINIITGATIPGGVPSMIKNIIKITIPISSWMKLDATTYKISISLGKTTFWTRLAFSRTEAVLRIKASEIAIHGSNPQKMNAA